MFLKKEVTVHMKHLRTPLDNAFKGREEASNQGPKQGARSLFVGHTSTSFPEDSKDLVSMLHRVCGHGGAYGGEETI